MLAEVADLEQEKNGLRDEILRLEQENMTLTEEKATLQETLAASERAHVSLQTESDRHAREKRELHSHLAAVSHKYS